MIEFRNVTFRYAPELPPVLSNVDLAIDEGDLCVVVGNTGGGKSTLLGMINGLVPHFTGGQLSGSVTVDGRSTETHPPRELADVVGYVGQEPLAGFVTDTVEEELAYSMEQLAVAPDVMRKRVEETLDLLGIAELRARPLRTLSGGQQQRVAIGAALTTHPKVLVLDEPTSALDPTASEEVLAAIARLCHDLGITVVMAEHRLERVVQFADRVISVSHPQNELGGSAGDPVGATVEIGLPADILARTEVVPPVVALGRIAGWTPLPLSVRDARRQAAPLREQLSGFPHGWLSVPELARGSASVDSNPAGAGLVARGVQVTYGPVAAVRNVDIDIAPGEIVALMGRNGSGKSSLLWAMQGSGPKSGGSIVVSDSARSTRTETSKLSRQDARRIIGLVPQTPSDLLYRTSVALECAQADAEAGVTPGATAALAQRLVGDLDPEAHPRDLSEGQRLGLVLAIQLVVEPEVVLLDEPTRGLDYLAKSRLGEILQDLAAAGKAVMLSTHDVEFVAAIAHRVVVMAEGEVVADGPTTEVVTSSPAFAPQVAKILAPATWLTPHQVQVALQR